jgi:hypothetical protein
MEVHAHLVPQFVEFLRLRYGADIRLHDEETRVKTKECARGFIRDDFVCLKYSQHHADGTWIDWGQNDHQSQMNVVDVVCSNAERVNKIDEEWRLFVAQAMDPNDDDTDRPNGSD